MRLAVAVGVFALITACSLDYESARLVERLSDDVPDTVLHGVTHTIVRDGRPRFVVRAARAETFSKRSMQYLYDAAFTELGRDGRTLAEGTAAYAEYHTGTEHIELTGNLRFFSAAEDAWLTAEYLYWNADERRLTSMPAELVRLERGDGTVVRGRGFAAEMATSTMRFDAGASGTISEVE